MDSHVTIEIPRLGKPQKTEFALVRLFSRVDSQMLRESGRVGESLFAQATPVRPLARVRPHVRRD